MNHFRKLIAICTIASVIGLCVLSGYGSRLTLSPVAVKAQGDVVTTDGRGGYDWPVAKGLLEVASPTTYSFVMSIDREKLKSNLMKHQFVEPANVAKPAGMDDDVWDWYSRIDLNHAEPKPLLELKADSEIGVSVVAFNFDGTRLWTVGGMLIEWDVATGKRLRSYKMMIKNCVQAIVERDGETIVLRSVEQILRISSRDGSMLGRWQPSKGTIASMAIARDADAIAVVTTANELYLVSDSFSTMRMFPRGPLNFKGLAIHPTGRTILASTAKGILRWRCGSENLDEEYFDFKADPGLMRNLSSGNDSVRGFTETSILDCINLRNTVPLKTATRMFNGIIVAGMNATVDGKQDWDVLVYKKNNLPESESFLIDASFTEFTSSVPWRFPDKNSSLVAGNSSFERLAFKVGEVLRVYDRRRWVNKHIVMVTKPIAGLALKGRFEQLEICAKDLRSKPWTRSGESGLVAYGMVAEHIGWDLGNAERNPTENTFDQKLLKEWMNAESELSELATIHQHRSYGTSRMQNTEVFYPEDRVRKVTSRLKPFMKQEVPPFEAIRNYIDCTDFGIEAEKHLKTAVENYPNESLVLASMCVRLLRNAREGGALTLAVSKNYPDNEAALLYARVALDVAWILLSKDYVIDQFGFSRAKILMIANRILEQNPTRNQVEILLALAQDGESPQIFDLIASYYYDHFEVTSDRYATLMDPKTRAKVAEKAFPNDKKL